MSDDEQDNGDELTPAERAAFQQLARTRVPAARLEETTVKALRRRRLLRNTNRPLLTRVAALTAAAGLVFAVGALAGYKTAVRRLAGRAQPIAQVPSAQVPTAQVPTVPPDTLAVQRVAAAAGR